VELTVREPPPGGSAISQQGGFAPTTRATIPCKPSPGWFTRRTPTKPGESSTAATSREDISAFYRPPALVRRCQGDSAAGSCTRRPRLVIVLGGRAVHWALSQGSRHSQSQGFSAKFSTRNIDRPRPGDMSVNFTYGQVAAWPIFSFTDPAIKATKYRNSLPGPVVHQFGTFPRSIKARTTATSHRLGLLRSSSTSVALQSLTPGSTGRAVASIPSMSEDESPGNSWFDYDAISIAINSGCGGNIQFVRSSQ